MLGSSITQRSISDGDVASSAGTNSGNTEMASGTNYGEQYAGHNGSNPPKFRRGSRTTRSFFEMQELKRKTRCLRCGKKGHWKNECNERTLSMTDAIRAHVKESGGTNLAVAEVLFEMVQDEDDFEDYSFHLNEEMEMLSNRI